MEYGQSARPARLSQPLNSPSGAVNSVAFRPDGRIMAVADGHSHEIWLWNLANPVGPERLRGPLTAPGITANSVAFSPDGSTLAAAGGDSHKVWLWDLTNPHHPSPLGQPLTGPADTVNSVVFSRDGNMCSTWRELDLGHWKQSVLKDFLSRHSAPVGPTSRERPG